MLFALLKKLQNYAIFMLKVIIIMPHYAHIHVCTCTYAANALMVLGKITGEFFVGVL